MVSSSFSLIRVRCWAPRAAVVSFRVFCGCRQLFYPKIRYAARKSTHQVWKLKFVTKLRKFRNGSRGINKTTKFPNLVLNRGLHIGALKQEHTILCLPRAFNVPVLTPTRIMEIRDFKPNSHCGRCYSSS